MRRLTVLLALAFTLALVPAIPAQAKKPLTGTANVEFNLLWPGLQPDIPDWVGNITINEGEYGITFFCIDAKDVGNVHFFEEIWAIYNTTFDTTSLLPSDDPTEWNYWLPSNTPAELILWGYDAGVVSLQNSKYRMNGNVEEAFGAFAVWQGRNVHISGIIEWQEIDGVVAPQYAPGIFRIN
jgi:hypothetical protein